MDISVCIKRKEKELKAVIENILDFSESRDVELNKAIPKYEVRKMELETELEALKKRAQKEPHEDKSDERTLFKCPDCGYIFVTQYSDGSLCAGRKSRHCPECGQAMKW